MATAVIMPKQGQSVETCLITKWFKKKGDRVSKGDILLSYETDKAAFDLESPDDGILLDIFFNDGDEVPVLVNIAAIGGEDETSENLRPGNFDTKDTALPSGSISIGDAESSTTGSSEATGKEETRIRISPKARRLAEEKGIKYSTIQGSGPNGRIISNDIERVISEKTMEPDDDHDSGKGYTEKPLSNVRTIIAVNMLTSLNSAAQLTHHMSADARHILDARQKIKDAATEAVYSSDITLNDIVCWCITRALEKHPAINSHLLDDRIRTFRKVDLGMAVDTPRGLMVPAIKNASAMDLNELSKATRSAAEACRNGKIDPELLHSSASSFTVSNLGPYGVEMFTPVLNLPQIGILGICNINYRPARTENDILGFVPFIGLSLTYDHRAVDGAPASLFLKEVKNQIEGFRL